MDANGELSYDQGHRFITRSLSITGSQGSALARFWRYHYHVDPMTGALHAPASIAFQISPNPARDAQIGYDDLGRMTRISSPNSGADKPQDEKPRELLTNRAMTWDAEGRLKGVRGVADGTWQKNDELLREEYVYDSGGNRTLKIDRPWDAVNGRQIETSTIYETSFYARPFDARGTVELSERNLPTAALSPPASGNEIPLTRYLYSDLSVGSVTSAVTVHGEPSQSSSAVIARREYSPFGLELTVEKSLPSVFHGKELDRATNFSSFGARYYSRDLGTWLSPDPAMAGYLTGSPNGGVYAQANLASFTYAHNRPTFANDPDGRWVHIAVGAAVGAVALGGYEYYRQVAAHEPRSWGRIAAFAGGGAAAGALTAATLGAAGLIPGVSASVPAAPTAVATVGAGAGKIAENPEEVTNAIENVGAETTTLFRMVSHPEFADVMESGMFRSSPNSIATGKFFAESGEDAVKWGNLLEGPGNFRVLQAEFPKAVADQFMRWGRLDSIGPARFGEYEQLGNAVIRPWADSP
jgi:RHS repeat-associated protein